MHKSLAITVSPQKPLALTVRSFCELTSLGRTTTYKMLQEGRIQSCLIGRRRLITMESAEAFLASAIAVTEGGQG